MIRATVGIFSQGGVSFDADYQAVLDYATTQGYTLPSASQKALQNQLVVDLKDAGVWSKLDLFYVFATDGDSDFASINWKDPNNFEITEVNSPTFTTNEGFQGDGSSSYLDTNFIPSTDSTKSTSNTLSAGGYIINKATSSYDNIIGVDSGSNDILIATKFSTEQPFFRINNTASFRPSFTTTVGFYGVSRSSFDSTTAILPNGTIENSDRSSASGLPSDILTIQKWAGLYANSTVSCAFYGGNVSSELSDFKTSVDNYITSI